MAVGGLVDDSESLSVLGAPPGGVCINCATLHAWVGS